MNNIDEIEMMEKDKIKIREFCRKEIIKIFIWSVTPHDISKEKFYKHTELKRDIKKQGVIK